MNKQDEETAEIIADEYIDREHQPQTYGGFVEALLTMATWKDEQFNEEKKVLFDLVNMLTIDDRNQTIIEDLKELLQ